MKAVLIIDMPEDCQSCPYQTAELCKLDLHKIARSYKDKIGKRNNKCPLKPFPEKKPALINEDASNTITVFYENGWNACLDKITGTTEPNTKKCGECRCFIRWSNFEPIYRGTKDGWCGYGKGDVSKDDVACEGFGEKDENNH